MKIRAYNTRTGVRRQSAVRLSSAPRLGVRRSPESVELRHLLRGPETAATNDVSTVQVHADHVPAGRVQLAPAPQRTRPAKVPGLTAPQTTRFFSDLNATLKRVLGGNPRLSLADFSILGTAAFAAFLKRSSDTSDDYLKAERLATDICSATTPDEFAHACGLSQPNPTCTGKIRQIQAAPGLCRRGRSTNELILRSIGTRGVTSPRGGPSVVIEEAAQNDMLRNIVHEGVHRLRGAVWKLRSVTGIRYMHSRARPPVQLDVIGRNLDEGTTQIITHFVINELQPPRGSWFSKGYVPTTYADELKSVWKMLADHGRPMDLRFLIRAYTATTDVKDVEDLQSWQ